MIAPGGYYRTAREKVTCAGGRSALWPEQAVVNIIPYNPGSSPIGRAPSEAETGAFIVRLRAAGAHVKLRSPRGRGLMAACGQLGRGN
jgi:adenine C2-methylase RlmN of 23S rRNA A2503 and tRNA A37